MKVMVKVVSVKFDEGGATVALLEPNKDFRVPEHHEAHVRVDDEAGRWFQERRGKVVSLRADDV